MALMSLSKTVSTLAPPLRQQLLETARESIRKGLCGETLKIDAADFPVPLQVPRATFVTLHVDGTLHGCVGTLEADKPLVEDVASNAWSAAFRDSRFPALTWPEFERLEIHISILSPPEPMMFSSEADLLVQLHPRVDGLILEDGCHRSTFLPSVWEQLPNPREFLRHLKLKAGLDSDHWSKNIRIHRYTAESIP